MQSSDMISALAPVVGVLKRLGVPHYIGGSVAGSAYGVMRATLDADLAADIREPHVGMFVRELEGKYYVNEKAVHDAVERRSCFNLIHLETMFKVDVFASKDRPFERDVFLRIVEKKLATAPNDFSANVASPEDVILFKLEWYRLGDEVSERQWRDISGILKVQGEALDFEYMKRQAVGLGVADILEKARKEISQ